MITKNTINKILDLLLLNNRDNLIDYIDKEYENAREKKLVNDARDLDALREKIKKVVTTTKTTHLDFSQNTNSTPTTLQKSSHSLELSDIVLSSANKMLVKQLTSEWKKKDILTKNGLLPTNKVLLWGAPGTGKSLLSKVLSHELGMSLVTLRLDEIISSYLGNTGKNIREAFDFAGRENVILLIEELDTIGKKRDDNNEVGELKRVVTVLLQNIDEFTQNSLLLCTTNHPELLDSAIWRRFDMVIKFDYPDLKERVKLFSYYLNGYKKHLNVRQLARYAKGHSPADIRQASIQGVKDFVLNKEKMSTSTILRHLLRLRLSKTNKDETKKLSYQIAKKLSKDGYTPMEIAKLTDIAYTTLRDNL